MLTFMCTRLHTLCNLMVKKKIFFVDSNRSTIDLLCGNLLQHIWIRLASRAHELAYVCVCVSVCYQRQYTVFGDTDIRFIVLSCRPLTHPQLGKEEVEQ